MKKMIRFCLIALITLFATVPGNVNAQLSGYTQATVSLTQVEYISMVQNGSTSIVQTGLASFIGDGLLGIGPVPGSINPPANPCTSEFTVARISQLQAHANLICRPVYACLRDQYCVYYIVIFEPTNPNCEVNGIQPDLDFIPAFKPIQS